MRALLFASVLVVGCGHSHDNGYATFQACYDEHTGNEGYAPPMAIAICTLDHPVGDVHLDFATSAECVAYVTANLAAGSATAAEIQAGCDDYITQKGQ